MPEEIAAILQEDRRNRYGEETPPPENYLCLNPEGEPIASNYLSQSFKQFLREHSLREIRLHDLRHTCASLLIQRRTPLIEVQQWLDTVRCPRRRTCMPTWNMKQNWPAHRR